MLPADAPQIARTTLRYDTLASFAKGIAVVGGPATAAVVAKKAFNADDFVVALLYSAMHVGQVAGIWVPRLLVRRSTIRVIFIAEAVSSSLMAVSAFMSSSWLFVAMLAGSYALAASMTPAYSRVYRQNYPSSMRGSLFAFVRIGFNASTTVFGFIVGRLLDVHPEAYAWTYMFLGLAGLIGSLIFRRITLRDEGAVSSAAQSSLGAYLRILKADHRYLTLLLIWAVFGFSNMLTEPVLAIYLTDPKYAISADYLQSLLVLLVIPQATVMLTLRLWGHYFDRYPVSVLRVWMQLFGGISILIFIYASRFEWLYLAAVLKGLRMAGGQMTWTLAMMQFAPRHQVTEYTAIHTLFTGIRGLIAPQTAAILVLLAGPIETFWVGLVGIALSVILMMLFPYITSSLPVPEGAPQPRYTPHFRQ